jgi:hypothetical protein
MASVGHLAVGLAAARAYHAGRAPRWSPMAAWSALSLIPDVDVVGFALGVEYGDPWGHALSGHRQRTVCVSKSKVAIVVGRWR